MKCSKCGAELSEDAKFCSYCGQRIAETPPPVIEETEIPLIPQVEKAREAKEGKVKSDVAKSLADKAKDKGIEIWNKLSLYGKVTTVSITVFVLLCLVALLARKTAAVVIAIIQIVTAVVSILVHKGVIKLEQKKLWLKWLVLVVAILFTVLNVMSYSWGTKTPKTERKPSSTNQDSGETAEQIDWENITLSKVLPEPQSNMMELLYNGDDWLSVTIHDISENNFLEYVRWCKEDYGFTVDSETFNDYYYAFNSEGCCVTLFYTQASKELNINLDVPTGDETDGSTQPTEESQTKPEATVPTSRTEYEIDYVDSKSFERALNDGVKVNGKIVQFDVVEYRPDSVLGINCWSGEHLNFISKETLDVGKGNIIVGRITEEPSKTLGSWKIPYEVLSIGGERIENEVTEPTNLEEPTSLEEPTDTQPAKIVITMGEDDFIGMLYTDAEAELREMGFTVFEYETIETKDINKLDDIIGAVEIKNGEYGYGGFAVGDTYNPDAIVVLRYYVYDESEPNLTVDNCPELAAMLANKAEIDKSYSTFATKYKGRIIEFDGRIDYCTKHGDYNTRFDYLVSAGDYDPNHQKGPTFKFEDVNYYDLNTDLDTVSVGLNVHIVAKVESFNSNSGLFYLDPVSVTGR